MVKTITLNGEETAVKLDKAYPYIWVQNLGGSDVYMSVKPGIVPDADGVITVPAGGGASTGEVEQTNTVYFLGSGKVEVSPQFNAFCPFFKAAGKGGDSAYTLPVATADTLGGVKSGGDISVSENGDVTITTDYIKGLSISGRTITVTKGDGTTFKLTTQDTNTQAVSGVKGSSEGSYRTGYINITAANVGAVPVSGGTMTGALVAQANTNYTTAQVRNATMSASAPSGGSNGQIHFQYS